MRTLVMSALGLLLLGAPVLTAAETPETGMTTILIPTYYQGPGAHGSTWWSYVYVDNHSPLPFTSPGVEFLVQFDPIPEATEHPAVPPGKSGLIDSPRAAEGLLLHTSAEVAEDLAFSAQFGQGEQSFDPGTQLPVIRDYEFWRRPVRLPSVNLFYGPVPARTTLRIYGIDALPGTTVRIDTDSPSFLSKLVTLHVPPSPAGLPRPLYPAYAQLFLQAEFPEEALGRSGASFTIVPLPLPSGEVPRIWAFITRTDNVQNVTTLQRPQ